MSNVMTKRAMTPLHAKYLSRIEGGRLGWTKEYLSQDQYHRLEDLFIAGLITYSNAHYDHRWVITNNGREALRKWEQKHFMLMDV